MKKVKWNEYRKKVNANDKAFAFYLYNCPKEPVSTFVNALDDCLFIEEYRRIDKPEKEYYHYHPDHLGSSSWITDQRGTPVQHIQYLPFGETWADQRSANWNAPYTFSGKEKDWETSYHYYGARYYDSEISIWLSVDPLASKYPSLSPYVYCMNNPMILVDPNGMEVIDAPYLIFNGSTNTLEIWEDGDTPDDYSDDVFLGSHDAHNNTASNSNGKWEDGTYEMKDKSSSHKHPGKYESDGTTPQDSPNGSYGTDGIYRAENFYETTTDKQRTGMGVHAGREHKEFSNRKTMGCIRTTPEGMKGIADAISNYGDLTRIIVKNNRTSSNSSNTNSINPMGYSLIRCLQINPAYTSGALRKVYPSYLE